MLSFAGRPKADAASGRALAAAEPTGAALAALDVVAYGFDRACDHEYWRENGRCTLPRALAISGYTLF